METQAVEFTHEETQAIGLVISLFLAERFGVSSLGGLIMLVSAMELADPDVLEAHLRSIVLKFADAEDFFNNPDDPIPDEDQLEARTRLRAKLDQRFAGYAEEGRTLWTSGT